MFRLIHEGSVAQGVRRIEAVTGKEAFRLAKQDEDTISELTAMLKTTRGRLKEELQKRFGRIKELEKEMASKRSKDVESATNDIMRKAELINGIKVFIGRYEDGFPMAALRRAADIIRQGAKSSIAVLGTVQDEGNVSLVVGVSGDLCQQGIDASVLIKQIAVEIDGSGGGRKDFAQAGGKNPAGLEKAFKKLRELIAKEKESL